MNVSNHVKVFLYIIFATSVITVIGLILTAGAPTVTYTEGTVVSANSTDNASHVVILEIRYEGDHHDDLDGRRRAMVAMSTAESCVINELSTYIESHGSSAVNKSTLDAAASNCESDTITITPKYYGDNNEL